MKNSNLTKVIVPCRFSYLHCFKAHSINDGEPKYSVSAIIDKNDKKTINEIEKAIEVAKNNYICRWGKLPSNYKTPLRDGDVQKADNEAYNNSFFLNANSISKPQVVNAKVQIITDEEEVYSGCYGRISVTFYPYNANGNCGIAAGLGNIQMIRRGKPLGDKISASEEFEVVEDAEIYAADVYEESILG